MKYINTFLICFCIICNTINERIEEYINESYDQLQTTECNEDLNNYILGKIAAYNAVLEFIDNVEH